MVGDKDGVRSFTGYDGNPGAEGTRSWADGVDVYDRSKKMS